jgi:hypothetical protein
MRDKEVKILKAFALWGYAATSFISGCSRDLSQNQLCLDFADTRWL